MGVSTIDWITIILSERGPGAGLSVRGMPRGALVATLRELAGLYEALPEVQAYDDVVTPPTKKRAKTTRVTNEAEAKGIRLGVRKLKAISLFLEHATSEMYALIVKHLSRHLGNPVR